MVRMFPVGHLQSDDGDFVVYNAILIQQVMWTHPKAEHLNH